MINQVFFLILLCLFTSCSFHTGMLGSGSAMVADNSDAEIRMAYGYSKSLNFLGIGGNEKDALVLEAKRNLYANANITDGQYIGQTTVDFKRTLLFPFFKTRVTLSAEIISFNQDTNQNQLDDLDDFISRNEVSDIYYEGQKVRYLYKGDTVDAQIVGLDGYHYWLKFVDTNNNFKIRRASVSKFKTKEKKAVVKRVKVIDQKLFTPPNPEKELVEFNYEGSQLTGELLSKEGSYYLIRMVRSNGERIGLYIHEDDIISKK